MLSAVEMSGVQCDGRFFPLNSYENRVYQVSLEDDDPLVVKFYRPKRWSDEAILEEHAFALALAEREIPVIAPLVDESMRSLLHYGGYRFALYPRRSGVWPELEDAERRRTVGRFIGRIHAVGALVEFHHRPTLGITEFGDEARAYLLQSDLLVDEVRFEYEDLTGELLDVVRERLDNTGYRKIRLHGDCHLSNVMWSAQHGPFFVDLDDCRMGPAVQDLWMLLSGSLDAMRGQLADFLAGYREFNDFNGAELDLIESLRTLRMIHYAAWLARRWSDPAFPQAFPWFATRTYWQEHVNSLREQREALAGPSLALI